MNKYVSTYEITKRFTWEAAHQLPGHDGKCANLHGHSYKCEITLRVDNRLILLGPKEGMVLDFSDLSEYMKKHIVEVWDHKFLVAGDEQWYILAKGIPALVDQCVVLDFRTTAENMSRYIYKTLVGILNEEHPEVKVQGVRLWETESGSAAYREEPVSIHPMFAPSPTFGRARGL